MNRTELTPQLWEKIRQEYISSSVSYRELSKKYGIGFSTLQRRGTREGWVSQKSQIESEVIHKSNDEMVSEMTSIYKRVCSISEQIVNKIEDYLAEADMSALVGTNSLRQITGAIKDLKEIGMFRADLDRKEQEARIRKLQKETEEEQTDTEIIVRFEGGDEYGD